MRLQQISSAKAWDVPPLATPADKFLLGSGNSCRDRQQQQQEHGRRARGAAAPRHDLGATRAKARPAAGKAARGEQDTRSTGVKQWIPMGGCREGPRLVKKLAASLAVRTRRRRRAAPGAHAALSTAAVPAAASQAGAAADERCAGAAFRGGQAAPAQACCCAGRPRRLRGRLHVRLAPTR